MKIYYCLCRRVEDGSEDRIKYHCRHWSTTAFDVYLSKDLNYYITKDVRNENE